jgi:hypothetical protein
LATIQIRLRKEPWLWASLLVTLAWPLVPGAYSRRSCARSPTRPALLPVGTLGTRTRCVRTATAMASGSGSVPPFLHKAKPRPSAFLWPCWNGQETRKSVFCPAFHFLYPRLEYVMGFGRISRRGILKIGSELLLVCGICAFTKAQPNDLNSSFWFSCRIKR